MPWEHHPVLEFARGWCPPAFSRIETARRAQQASALRPARSATVMGVAGTVRRSVGR